ncbi:MAG: hypothetical protein RL660_1697 [Bacteroidota bacterium]|jgi:hypothetical protein
MILQTAINHFNEDIQRAKDLNSYAAGLAEGTIRNDILRTAWMMAVGSLDAYFCDAYGDLVARTFRAKRSEPGIQLPSKMKSIMVPIPVVLDNDLTSGWLWRMIARDLIEKDNVLSVKKIKELFNVFFRDTHKLFTANGVPLDRWITRQQSMHRLFGFNRTAYRQATGQARVALRKAAIEHMEVRLSVIFQRRHDCIHNCDRPLIAVNNRNITPPYVRNVIEDVEYIIIRCQEDVLTEFPKFLTALGFSAVTRNSVGV